jgi:hypothetical protein
MDDLSPEERYRIYQEEKARVESVSQLPTGAKKSYQLGKVLIALLSAVALCAGIGTVAYRQYRIAGLKQKLGDAIGKDLGLTETILKVESDSSKITFGEVFDLCNKSVENRTNLIVELRGLYPEIDYNLKTRLLEYLTAENEFVRAKRAFYRKAMKQSSMVTTYIETLNERPASIYGFGYLRSRVRQLQAKLLEAARESEQSSDDFLKAYDKMSKEEAAVANEAQAAGLRFDPVFQKYAKGNQKKALDTKKEAVGFATMLVAQMH